MWALKVCSGHGCSHARPCQVDEDRPLYTEPPFKLILMMHLFHTLSTEPNFQLSAEPESMLQLPVPKV